MPKRVRRNRFGDSCQGHQTLHCLPQSHSRKGLTIAVVKNQVRLRITIGQTLKVCFQRLSRESPQGNQTLSPSLAAHANKACLELKVTPLQIDKLREP